MMKLEKRKNRWLDWLMLGLMLFAQAVVGASACALPGPAQAIVHDAAAMPCHDTGHTTSSACLVHCSLSDQISADQHHIPAMAPAGVIAWVGGLPQVQRIYPAGACEHQAPDTGPPIPIRFCSLLN